MVGNLKYLVDTNVWLEVLLNQQKAEEARAFFRRIDSSLMALSEFSLYSLGIILTRLKQDQLFTKFLADTSDNEVNLIRLGLDDLKQLIKIRTEHKLDFDDAYQYAAAEKDDLVIVSFDKGFDKTPRGRKSPAEIKRNDTLLL